MHIQEFAQQFATELANQMYQDIYREIVMQHIIAAIKAGLIAGLIMAVVGTIIGMLKITKLDLTTYTGCMLSGQSKGSAPFVAGFIFHMIVSAVLGVVYLYLIHTFKLPATLQTGIILGVLNTLFSGTLMLVMDVINPCVRSGKVERMGFMVTAQGLPATLVYFFLHIVYAVCVIKFLA
ncbi:hypothetical protein KBD08_00420 [Candidatus Babeliales bacterium]|nr:hypothetical protein [Candidatus Babeliales bacterium]